MQILIVNLLLRLLYKNFDTTIAMKIQCVEASDDSDITDSVNSLSDQLERNKITYLHIRDISSAQNLIKHF